jgi:hypothetical protein
MAPTTWSPAAMNSAAVGSTKKAMRARPKRTRWPSASASSSWRADSSGSSAAAMLMPNRLIGSRYSTWAADRAATAAPASRLASTTSRNAESCTPPRAATIGTNAPTASRTPACPVRRLGHTPPVRRHTSGSWTASCSTPPPSTPQASAVARSVSSPGSASTLSPPVSTTAAAISAAIWAAFHTTGAT